MRNTLTSRGDAGRHLGPAGKNEHYPHSLAVRQEVCAMMALNMLRRWLNGKEVASEHGWINVVESLFVEYKTWPGLFAPAVFSPAPSPAG